MSYIRKDILDKYNKYKGQFVILSYNDIVRFVALAFDESDYLYVGFNGRDFKFYTINSMMVPLKGFIEDKYYNEYIRLSNLNHYDKIDYDSFINAFNNWKLNIKNNITFITDFEFRLL